MGYYTRHDLEIVSGNDFVTDYKSEISKITGYQNVFIERVKWYDHKENMLFYSKSHPKTIFKIIGVGEEPNDQWEEYYLNGKMQRVEARITFEDLDLSKLK